MMSNGTKDGAKQEKQGKMKSVFSLIRKSAEQTSDACGPGCGCHAEPEESKKESKTEKGS